MDIEQIVSAMWDALDAADENLHIGVRADDAVVKHFRRSWNRPDGQKTTRLPGVSVVYVGYNGITEDKLRKAIIKAQMYGKNLYLLAGDSPTDVQDQYANDPGERIFTTHKILYSAIQESLFPDEGAARTYLESRRWPKGPRCPVCDSGERIGQHSPGFFRCNACKEAFTVRTGTVMERSKIPLRLWLYTMYLMVTARKGVSSLQLSKEIGITQKSAWFMLHRLREACGK